MIAERDAQPQDIYLVFQMAKVASRSWSGLLNRHCPDALVSHFHAISNKRIRKIEGWMEASADTQTIKHLTLPRLGRPKPDIAPYIADGKWVGPSAVLISGVRDPVARAISATGFLGNRLGYTRAAVTPRDGGTVDNVLELFHRAVAVAREGDPGDDTLVSLLGGIIGDFDLWFEEEVNSAFGLDIKTASFDREACALTLERGHKLFVYRMEDLKDPACRARVVQTAGRLTGKSFGPFPSFDVSGERRYQALYRPVVEKLKLDQDTLDWFYNNETMTKFYSAAEIEGFRKRWQG